MQKKIMKNLFYIAGILIAILCSCNSTKIATSWKAENYSAPKFKHIMVWGILTAQDSTLRQKIEHHMADDLKTYGYDAVTSMDIYGSKAFDKMEESTVINQFKNSGVDAVITIVLLNKTKELEYQPAAIIYKPIPEYQYMEKYYSSEYVKIYTPGYYSTKTKYYWESHLYDIKKGQLAYVVQTNSFNPSSRERLAHENGQLILKDMSKKILLKNLAPED